MEWFTLGPEALRTLRETTTRLRGRLGTTHAADRVRGLEEAEHRDFVNEVLALVDEAEAILRRTRATAPQRERLPNPFAASRRQAP